MQVARPASVLRTSTSCYFRPAALWHSSEIVRLFGGWTTSCQNGPPSYCRVPLRVLATPPNSTPLDQTPVRANSAAQRAAGRPSARGRLCVPGPFYQPTNNYTGARASPLCGSHSPVSIVNPGNVYVRVSPMSSLRVPLVVFEFHEPPHYV